MKMSDEPPEPPDEPIIELSDLQKEEIEMMEKAVKLWVDCLNKIEDFNPEFWDNFDTYEVLDDLAYCGADYTDYITLEE